MDDSESPTIELTRRTVIETGSTALLLTTLPCLTLAVMHDGQSVTTIEGLAEGENLHPLQTAFVEHAAHILPKSASTWIPAKCVCGAC